MTDDLTLSQVVARLGKSERTVQGYMAAHPVHHFVGRSPRWTETELEMLKRALTEAERERRAKRERAKRRPGWVKNPTGSEAAQKRTGFVYFVQLGDGDIKIGFATDVAKRIRSLQTACSVPLMLLCAVEGSVALERTLHTRLGKDRRVGEWFRPSFQVIDTIRKIKADGGYRG